MLYVDGTHGSDSNSGTKLEPLATIGKAASLATANNAENIGTRIIINPGTYRESVTVNRPHNNTTKPITFEAATNGTVIISGADVWTGWLESGNLYTHSWPYSWGDCAAQPAPAPLQQEILLRQETMLINGTPMTQVLSKAAMQPGTFFANESNATLYVWPPSGTNMSTATVEVATRPSLFSDDNLAYIVLRGLTFQYANSCRGSAAVSFSGSSTNNILVDTSTFNHNNAVGLSFTDVENFTVESSTANHNGQKGFATFQVKYGLWQSDTANYNNWRGAQSAFYTYDSGSFRLFLDHDSTFTSNTELFNQTQGIHFDTDNENVTITGNVLANNLYGLLLEKSQGPVTVTNSYFCANNQGNQVNAGGFDFRNSSSVTFTSDTFYGNLANQITLNGLIGGISVTNWETGQTYNLINDHISLSKNTIATNSNTSRTFYDSYLNGTAWTDFVTTLSSEDNVWAAGTNADAFMVPTPKTGSLTSFSGWQTLTSQDTHSTWETSAKQPTQCNVKPDAADYWLITSNLTPVTASPAGQASFSLTTIPIGGLTGTVNLTVDGVTAISGATSSFSPASTTTSGAASLTVSTKTTTPAGTYPVTVIANSGNLTRTVTVSLLVPVTSVRLSADSLTFPGQIIKTTSGAKKITVTNSGKTSLTISSIAVGSNFAETNTCGSKLAAGATCTISVTFTPAYIGTPTSKLTITDADGTSPQIVSLTGTGLAK